MELSRKKVKYEDLNSKSLFTVPAEKLWKSVTSVSNAGAKKGRGRGQNRIRIRDLNRGQIIGLGKVNMLWPGLSAPIIRGRELLKQQRLPDDPERYSNKVIKKEILLNKSQYQVGNINKS